MTVLHSDFAVKYDPIKEFIEQLEKWEEGDSDWIKLLAQAVEVPDPEYFERCLKKWLVAMVASLIDPEVVNHTVIVFQGDQGVGKTKWFEKLVPNELKGYTYSGVVRPGNKDTEIQLTETILINIDDFEILCKGNSSALKELITKKVIRQRRPYGYHSENYVRRASFVASTNNNEFLGDTTGSRRFLCFQVSKINYQHTVPIDRVWAQATYLYHKNFKYWFDNEDIIELERNNDSFRSRTSDEQLLEQFFEPGNKEDHTHILNSTEIIQFIKGKLGNNVGYSLNIMRLGKVLNSRGYVQVKQNGTKRYYLKTLPSKNPGMSIKKLLRDMKGEVG